jgi:hypothetical protein
MYFPSLSPEYSSLTAFKSLSRCIIFAIDGTFHFGRADHHTLPSLLERGESLSIDFVFFQHPESRQGVYPQNDSKQVERKWGSFNVNGNCPRHPCCACLSAFVSISDFLPWKQDSFFLPQAHQVVGL